MTLLEKIYETRDFLQAKGVTEPEFGLILGSGLGELAEEIENAIVVDYADIPNWGRSTVVGHAGKLVYGDQCCWRNWFWSWHFDAYQRPY